MVQDSTIFTTAVSCLGLAPCGGRLQVKLWSAAQAAFDFYCAELE